MILLAWTLAATGAVFCANAGERHPAWRPAAYSGVLLVAVSGGLVLASPAGWLGMTVAGVALLPMVRRAFAEAWPLFHDESPLHAVVLGLYFATLTVALHLQLAPGSPGARLAVSGPPVALLLVPVALLALAMLGAGLGTRRDLGATLHRLGADRFSRRATALCALAGLVAALALAALHGAAHLLLPAAAALPATTLDLPSALGRQALPFTLGAVILLLPEEVVLRGAVRPRLGNFYPSVLFAVLHAPAGPGLGAADVFLAGMVLGRAWQRGGIVGAVVARVVFAATALAVAWAFAPR